MIRRNMSSLVKVLVIGLIIAACLPVYAKLMLPQQALQAAQAYLAQNTQSKSMNTSVEQIMAYQNGKLTSIDEKQTVTQETTLYFVAFKGANYAVVAAEDNFEPILAYSVDGLTNPNDMPPAFYAWLDYYSAQISEIRNNKVVVEENITKWNALLSGNYRFEPKTNRSVNPLVTAMWNQDWPYNALCPADAAGPGGRVYAGCVATAMGMVMKYWNHPTTGVGNNSYYASGYGYQSANFGATTYLWDEMGDSIGTDYLPIATLLYHCGVAVNMGYAPDGSGAQSTDAAEAMVDHFRYPTAQYVSKDNYTNTTWNALMTAQIDNGSPVYYSGYSTGGGHAFVLDGYDTANHFHFNFGWGGSSNGYFNTTNINGFSEWNAAIINSIPANYTINSVPVKLIAANTTVGDNFNLRVTTNPILGSWNINHYDMQLYYDHNNVQYVGYSVDGTISENGNITVTEETPGVISVNWNNTSTLAGGGNLIQFTFNAMDVGDYLFDIIALNYNTTTVTNTTFTMVNATAPVATLAQSQISLSNIMHLAYNAIGTTELRTTYLLPSWNVEHYQTHVNFNPDKLEFVGIQTAGTLSEGLEVQASVTAPGVLTLTCDMPNALTGAGILAKLQFRAIGNSSSLSVTQLAISDFFFNTTAITAVGTANVILSAYSANEDELLNNPILALNAYPNPFSTGTLLRFEGGSKAPVTVQIYNLKGQLINKMQLDNPETKEIHWMGDDLNGKSVSNGMYFVSWNQDGKAGSSKILKLK